MGSSNLSRDIALFPVYLFIQFLHLLVWNWLLPDLDPTSLPGPSVTIPILGCTIIKAVVHTHCWLSAISSTSSSSFQYVHTQQHTRFLCKRLDVSFTSRRYRRKHKFLNTPEPTASISVPVHLSINNAHPDLDDILIDSSKLPSLVPVLRGGARARGSSSTPTKTSAAKGSSSVKKNSSSSLTRSTKTLTNHGAPRDFSMYIAVTKYRSNHKLNCAYVAACNVT